MGRKDRGGKKGKKGKGLFGGLFGGKEGGDPAATPGGAPQDPQHTMAPSYAPPPASGHVSFGAPGEQKIEQTDPFNFDNPEQGGGAGGLTMAPGYAAGGPPGAVPGAGELTMAPGYAAGGPPGAAPGAGELTMAPGYAAGGPPGAVPGAGELTMAPGYAAGGPPPGGGPPPSGGPDPYDPGAAAEMTMVPDYGGGDDELDPYNPGESAEMTLAPGYALGDIGPRPAPPGLGGPPPSNPGGLPSPPDPFADFDGGGGGDLTMAPGYAGGAAPAGAASPRDPFADFDGGGGGDLTMAPGYAGGAPGAPMGGAPSGAPMGGAPVGGELTMAPGYAGGPGAPAGGELTMAPGYAGGAPGAPAGGDLTMAPGYAGGAPQPADPFNFDAPANQAAGVPDPFNFDDPLGATAPQVDPYSAPTVAQGPVMPAGAMPTDPNDPFGPALLNDPGPGVSYAAAPSASPADPFADPLGGAIEEGGAERTMVDLDLQANMSGLESLRPGTEELEISDLEPLGAPASPPGVPSAPAPMMSTAGASPLFGAARQEGADTVYAQPAAQVVLDEAKGLVYAPPVAGGWSGVPAAFRVLSDGSVMGHAQIEAGSVRVSSPAALDRASAQDGMLKLPPFPAGTHVDRQTGAVLVPSAVAGTLAWRPERVYRTEAGVSFLLPKGFAFDPDGTCSIPVSAVEVGGSSPAATPAAAAGDHGAVVHELRYLGLTERRYADGWVCLALSPEAEPTEDGRLLLPADAGDGSGCVPPLLRVGRADDGRLELFLPPGTLQRTDGLWFKSLSFAVDDSEPLADADASVQDTREYMGIRDELLSDGWVRLELPAGARVEDGCLLLPAEYEALGEPALRGQFDPTEDASLSFRLPAGAEALGSRVLVPPSDYTPPVAKAPAPKAPEPAAESKKKDKKKKTSAMDRFRSGKSEPKDDVINFDGVLKSDGDPEPEAEAKTEETWVEQGPPPPNASDEDAKADDDDAKADDDDAKADDDDAKADDDDAKADDDDAKADDDDAKADDDDAKADDDDAEADDDDAKADDDDDDASNSKKKKKKKKRKTSRKKKKKS